MRWCRQSFETSSPCPTKSRSGTATSGARRVYFPLTSDVAHRKVELLHKCFPSQASRDWWDDEVFLGLARLRGMESRAPYSEAFTCTKSVITPLSPSHTASARHSAATGTAPIDAGGLEHDRLRRSRRTSSRPATEHLRRGRGRAHEPALGPAVRRLHAGAAHRALQALRPRTCPRAHRQGGDGEAARLLEAALHPFSEVEGTWSAASSAKPASTRRDALRRPQAPHLLSRWSSDHRDRLRLPVAPRRLVRGTRTTDQLVASRVRRS